MYNLKPEISSTPKVVGHISGRRGVRDYAVPSPIYQNDSESFKKSNLSPRRSPRFAPQNESDLRLRKRTVSPGKNTDSAESDDGSVEGHYDSNVNENEEHSQQSRTNILGFWSYIALVSFLLFLLWLYWYTDKTSEIYTVDESKFKDIEAFKPGKSFEKQNNDFWINLKVNIKDIKSFKQPRSIIFLYEPKSRTTLDSILDDVSRLATCHLSACSHTPIIINGPSLNNSEIVTDYGQIIENYRASLKEKAVMIIKNLEKVPGQSAQAFHSFCDTYNPVVENALFLFTLEINALPKEYPIKFLENFLLTLWNDLGRDDKFYPLFTRISETILLVRS